MKITMIIGNLTQDSEVTHVTKTRSVCNFTVAVNERYKDKDGNSCDKVEYFECAYWRDAENIHKVADLLKKGVKIHVTGDPSSRAFMKNDTPQSANKIEVSRIEILSALNKNN